MKWIAFLMQSDFLYIHGINRSDVMHMCACTRSFPFYTRNIEKSGDEAKEIRLCIPASTFQSQ